MKRSFRSQLGSGPVLAAVLAVCVFIWMVSGVFIESPALKPSVKQVEAIASVQVRRVQARPVARELNLSGTTQADQQVQLTSERDVKVEQIVVQQGQLVSKGDILIRLDPKDWPARLKEAEALVTQRSLEYKSAAELQRKGLQNETKRVEALARLESSKAQMIAAKHQVLVSDIRAPFAGTFERKQVEVGDFVSKGQVLGQLVSASPVVVNAQVPEVHQHWLKKGIPADIKLVTGRHYQGRVRFISTLADQATRSYPIEIEINNEQAALDIPYGMTATVRLESGQVDAIFVSPSLLVLNHAGDLGVKAVSQSRAVFVPAQLIRAEQAGVWLDIAQPSIDLIEVGAGFVKEGDQVQAYRADGAVKTPKVDSKAKPMAQLNNAVPGIGSGPGSKVRAVERAL